MFHTGLPAELAPLHWELEFSAKEILQLQLKAADGSRLPADEKSQLRRRIETDPLWTHSPHA